MRPPRCRFAAPPQGGGAGAPAEPDAQRLLVRVGFATLGRAHMSVVRTALGFGGVS
jgi:hypothetical protein